MRLYPRTRLLFDCAPNMAAINFALPSYQFPACIRLERRQFLSRQTFFSPMFPPELYCFYPLSFRSISPLEYYENVSIDRYGGENENEFWPRICEYR